MVGRETLGLPVEGVNSDAENSPGLTWPRRGLTLVSNIYTSLTVLTCLFSALAKFRSSPSAQDVNFTVKYFPFQLYPEASKEGEDKYEW